MLEAVIQMLQQFNWVETNAGLFLLPLMSLALIQLLLINFHQAEFSVKMRART